MGRGTRFHAVVEAAIETHRRRLWERFSNYHCFAVQIPGEKGPMLASVMGGGGEQFGVMFMRGPHAVDCFLELTGSEGPGEHAAEVIDMLGFSMDRFGDLPPESKKAFREAGLRPGQHELMPSFIAKPLHRQPRLPDKDELQALFAALRAIVVADERRMLKPCTVDDAQGVCVLTVSGDAANPTVTVKRARLAASAGAAGPHVFAGSGVDLSGLSRRGGAWLVGTPVMPGVADDDRSMLLLLVVDESSLFILHARPFFSEALRDAVEELVGTFRRHGLPERVVFTNRQLHDAVAGALQAARVGSEYAPSHRKLQHVMNEFLGSLGINMPSLREYLGDDAFDSDGYSDESEGVPVERDGASEPAPDDLDGWKRADRLLANRFAEFLMNDARMQSRRPVKQYFGEDDLLHYMKEHEQRGVLGAFASWAVLDYRVRKNGRTHAEAMLAAGLAPGQAALLRARVQSTPTVYRVARHNAEAGTADLQDVLLGGEAVTVYDRLLSQHLDDGMFLVGRAYPAGRFCFFEVVGPPLGAGMGLEAVEFLQESGMLFTPDGIRHKAHLFGWLWAWVEEWQANWQPPKLCNTDGDDLLLHTASFSVANPVKARKALLARRDIEHDEEADRYIWLNPRGRGAKALGGPVTLGQIEFVGDELVVTVNSAERFTKARAWLKKLPGVRFKGVATREVTPDGLGIPPDDRMDGDASPELAPEEMQAIQQMIHRQCMAWIDTALPAFGNKSPRQACKTVEGRERVTVMIRTMPDPVGPVPITLPREMMLRELGLAADDPDAASP